MEGVPEDVLSILIAKGYFKTKTEAIRAGILELGKEYHILDDLSASELDLVARKILKQDKQMKKKNQKYLTEEEVKKKYGFK
ncbi:MAG: hypothetical protein AABW72_04980 [archaeon]